MRDRAMDLAIAGTLALLPLFPRGRRGSACSGRGRSKWSSWCSRRSRCSWSSRRVRRLNRSPSPPSSAARRAGYLIWLIPVVAAMIIGLLERNPLDAHLIESRLTACSAGSRRRWIKRPIRFIRFAWPQVVEGGLMFFLLSAILRRTPEPGRRARTALGGCMLAWPSSAPSPSCSTYAGESARILGASEPRSHAQHATLDDPNALARSWYSGRAWRAASPGLPRACAVGPWRFCRRPGVCRHHDDRFARGPCRGGHRPRDGDGSLAGRSDYRHPV